MLIVTSDRKLILLDRVIVIDEQQLILLLFYSLYYTILSNFILSLIEMDNRGEVSQNLSGTTFDWGNIFAGGKS